MKELSQVHCSLFTCPAVTNIGIILILLPINEEKRLTMNRVTGWLTFPPPMPMPQLLSRSSRSVWQVVLLSNFSMPFTPSGPNALSLRSKTVSLAPAIIKASPREFYNTRWITRGRIGWLWSRGDFWVEKMLQRVLWGGGGEPTHITFWGKNCQQCLFVTITKYNSVNLICLLTCFGFRNEQHGRRYSSCTKTLVGAWHLENTIDV